MAGEARSRVGSILPVEFLLFSSIARNTPDCSRFGCTKPWLRPLCWALEAKTRSSGGSRGCHCRPKDSQTCHSCEAGACERHFFPLEVVEVQATFPSMVVNNEALIWRARCKACASRSR